MANAVTGISFSPGYITLTYEGGAQVEHGVADILRAIDIPTGLTYTQVAAISTLANHLVVLIRTLINRDVLNESFLEDGDLDLDAMIASIEAMGGDYADPDISGE